MPWKEATFWIGLTVFGTGLYFIIEPYVNERASKRTFWLALVVCLSGASAVGYSMYAYYVPTVPRLPVWLYLLILTWGLIGWDLYDRHTRSREDAFVNPKWEIVSDREFRNERVSVDGKRFYKCKFENTSVLFQGIAPTEFIDCEIGKGTVILETDDEAAKHYVQLCRMFGGSPGLEEIGVMVVDSKGKTEPIVSGLREVRTIDPLKKDESPCHGFNNLAGLMSEVY